MLATSIRHGDLVLDYESDGSVRMTRQSNAMAIQLSISEWGFVQATAQLAGWPVVAPHELQRVIDSIHGKTELSTPGD
jgi:hypothetical protein